MYNVTPVTSPKSYDCGPTCLKMLLSYYGVDVDLDTLTRECNTRLVGVSGADLMRVGQAHGLDMTAWRMSADELIRQDRPGIINWRFQHWCMFCGQDEDGNVVIVNPDMGRYRMKPDTFATLYSGTALFNGTPYPLDQFPADYFGENTPEPEYFDK